MLKPGETMPSAAFFQKAERLYQVVEFLGSIHHISISPNNNMPPGPYFNGTGKKGGYYVIYDHKAAVVRRVTTKVAEKEAAKASVRKSLRERFDEHRLFIITGGSVEAGSDDYGLENITSEVQDLFGLHWRVRLPSGVDLEEKLRDALTNNGYDPWVDLRIVVAVNNRK